MKKISIKDIARQAGVVPSTVSFVLNGKAKEMRISDIVAEKINALAKEIGYQPNRTAVSLRTGKTKIIGLIVEDISNTFFASLAKQVEDTAYQEGYRIVYCSTENDDEKGCELINMMFHQQVDGFLITPCKGMAKDIARLMDLHKPVVLMDRYFPEINVPYVLAENYGGVTEAVSHIYNKGYKKIGFVNISPFQMQMHQREMGFREAVNFHYGTGNELVLHINYGLNSEDAISTICSFIKANPEMDAILFATNYLGIYGLQSLKRLGLSIPSDMAMVCFDDHDIFRIYSPTITVIQQPIEEIAKTAVELLLKQFNGVSLQSDEFYVLKKTQLIIREST